MKKLIIAATLLLATSICQAGEPDKDLHNKCIYPTVMLQGKNGGTGSGVIIKSVKRGESYMNYVFTCAHVLKKTPARIIEPEEPKEGEEAAAPIVIPSKYEYIIHIAVYEDWSLIKEIKTYKCNVIHVENDVLKDVALVTFKTKEKMKVAEIETKPKIYIGNEVLRIGCGVGEPFRIDYGKVTSLSKSIGRAQPATKGKIRTSIQTVPGDSGGPVYHENKLIGVAQMIRAMPGNAGPFPTSIPIFHMSYVIPMEKFMSCEKITKHLKDRPAPVVEEEVAPPPPVVVPPPPVVEEEQP